MGARHQLYVIARINRRYRCLAALHNGWLSGALVLERCLALLKIFQAKGNRIAIQQELRAAERCGAEVWQPGTRSDDGEQLESYGHRVAPFPFIATCLLVGSSFDAVKGYQEHVRLLDHVMSIEPGNNNSGWTILDITTPQEPRYCFVNINDAEENREIDDEGTESDRSEIGEDASTRLTIPSVIPVLASSYLRRYYSRKDLRAQPELRGLIQELEAHPLIDGNSLKNLWENHDVARDDGENSPSSTAPSAIPKSLSDIAVDKVIEYIVEQRSILLDQFSEVLTSPIVRTTLRDKLFAEAENKRLKASPAAIELVSKVLSNEGHVDLAPFHDFSSTDLCSVIAKLHEYGNLISLNLSNNLSIDEKGLLGVLDHRSSVQTLYLLGDSHISLEAIQSVSENPGSRLRKVYHSAQFRRPFHHFLQHDNAEDTKYVESLASTPGTNAQNKISGVIWVSVDGASNEIRKSGATEAGRIDWQKIAERSQEGPGSTMIPVDHHIRYGIFPLQDMTITPMQLVDSLINLRSCMYGERFPRSYNTSDIGLIFAKAIAATSAVRDATSNEIGPLPGALYAVCSITAPIINAPPWPIGLPEMASDQWTVLIIHEYVHPSIEKEKDISRKTRCVLISRLNAETDSCHKVRYCVIDVETFLSTTMESSADTSQRGKDNLKACWKENGPSFAGICESEVHEILSVLEKEVAVARSHRSFHVCYGVRY